MDMIGDIVLGHSNGVERFDWMMYQLKITLKLTIRSTPGVQIMENEKFAVSGRQ